MLGKTLQGRYQIVEFLSFGGFGQTYIARDISKPKRPICVVKHLKLVSNYPSSLITLNRLFTREAEALKKLSKHNQIPQLLAYFEEDEEFYLVEEFIAGHSLSAELLPGQCWSESQVVQMLQDVLSILKFVHSHGLIHRDIKPSNLIRRQQDNRLVLIDFGSVKQVWTQVVTDRGKTSTTTASDIPVTISIGTPGYAPIEQLRGWPVPSSDIYALGIMAIQALTGLSPTRLLEDPSTGELYLTTPVSVELANVLSNMVCEKVKDRYQSATQALQALKPLVNIYSSTQSKSISGKRSLGLKASTPSLIPSKAIPEVAPCMQDTIISDFGDYLETLSASKTKLASPSSPPIKSALLIGLSIGIVSALALIVGSYCILKITTLMSPPQVVSDK